MLRYVCWPSVLELGCMGSGSRECIRVFAGGAKDKSGFSENWRIPLT